MVVDTSALCVVLFGESRREEFREALLRPEPKFLSAVSRFELGLVVIARLGDGLRERIDELLSLARIEVVAFDDKQSRIAVEAWRRFGKGRHRAGLNLGDCASYALAKAKGMNLLFQGEGFAQTDIGCVL